MAQRALQLLQTVVESTSKGERLKQPPFDPLLTDPAAAQAAADAKPAKGGKDAKAAAKKGAPAAAAEAPPAATGPPDTPVTCTLEAWHVDVLAQARLQAAEVHEALWQPAEALRQLHLAMAFLHSPAADSTNGLADSPSDVLAYTFSGARWLSLLDTRCRLLLQLQDGTAASAAAQGMAECAAKLRCRRSRAVAAAAEAAAAAQRGSAADALQLYGKSQSVFAAVGDTSVHTAAVLLAHGDLRCTLGMRDKAHQLWLLAADLLRAEARSRGLQEEMATPELVNIYASERPLHVRALLCAAQSQMWSGDIAAAQALTVEALAVLPLCRVGPDVAALAHLTHGRLLLWQRALQAQGRPHNSAAADCEVEAGCYGGGGEFSVEIAALQKASEMANRELGGGVRTLQDALIHAAIVHAWPALASGGCSAELSAGAVVTVEGLVRAASSVAAAQLALQQANGGLGKVDLAALPQWFVSQVRGGDARHMESTQRTKAAADEGELQESVWPCFWRLCAAPAAGMPVAAALTHALQHADVHRALVAAVPPYKEQCCLACMPSMVQEVVEDGGGGRDDAEGAVVAAQWLRESAPGYTGSEDEGRGLAGKQALGVSVAGSGATSAVSVAQVLQVLRPTAFCSLVFVVRRPGTTEVASEDEAGGEGGNAGGRRADAYAGVRLAGVLTVEDACRWSTLQEVRRVRLALEARSSGTERLLIRRGSTEAEQDGFSGAEVRLRMLVRGGGLPCSVDVL